MFKNEGALLDPVSLAVSDCLKMDAPEMDLVRFNCEPC